MWNNESLESISTSSSQICHTRPVWSPRHFPASYVPGAAAYLYDIIIHSNTWAEHVQRLMTPPEEMCCWIEGGKYLGYHLLRLQLKKTTTITSCWRRLHTPNFPLPFTVQTDILRPRAGTGGGSTARLCTWAGWRESKYSTVEKKCLHHMNTRITWLYLALQPFKFKVTHRPGGQMAVVGRVGSTNSHCFSDIGTWRKTNGDRWKTGEWTTCENLHSVRGV